MNPQKDITGLEESLDDVTKRIETLETQLEALEEAEAKVNTDSKFAQEMLGKGVPVIDVIKWLESRDYGIETE